MFRIGQKVICVRDDFNFIGTTLIDVSHMNLPKKGRIYTVTDIFDHYRPVIGLLLREIDNKNPRQSFCSTGFRPVCDRPTDISIFKKMLEPKQQALTAGSNKRNPVIWE